MCKNINSNMPKFHKQLHFNNKVLQQLITTENSCVEVQKNSKHITLFPYHLSNISSSIKEILNQGIARYDSDLDGILLGYKNIKLQSELGHLNSDACFIHIDIQADFYIFKPIIGNQLPAIVTKKSKDHVGCLVYQTFNVSLPKPEGIENWTGNDVEIGQEVIVRITYSNLDERLPYIRGEFLNNFSEFPPVQKKNKKIVFHDSDELENDKVEEKKKNHEDSKEFINGEPTELHEESMNKKKKKRKFKDEEIINGEPSDIQNETPIKKKKKNKSFNEDTISETQENKRITTETFNGETSNSHEESFQIKKKKHKKSKEVEDAADSQESVIKLKKKRKETNGDLDETLEKSRKKRKNSEECDESHEDANHKRKKRKKENSN